MYKNKKSEMQMLDLIFCSILQEGFFLFVFFRLCYNGERNFENAMF